MKTSLECIPCLITQTLRMSRMLSASTNVHERIVRDILRLASEMDLRLSPPALAQQIHRQLKKVTGVRDPYREEKEQENRMALQLFPEFRTRVKTASDPMATATRFAIAGNVIDMGVNGALSFADIRKNMQKAVTDTFFGDRIEFRKSVKDAERILYLTDNAGEIVFDRLLIEQLSTKKVTVAVRGEPVLNDATVTDARSGGLHEIVDIISNGSDAPGTLLDDCSQEFLEYYEEADLIIAKGQGNYESLSDEKRNIYFLLKVKCPVIASHVGYPVGSQLMIRSNTRRQLAARTDFSTHNHGERVFASAAGS